MLKAVIFDFDGVIVDSEPLHYRAFVRLAAELGRTMTWEQYLQTYIGYDDRDVLRLLLGLEPGRRGSPEQERRIAHLARQKGQVFEDEVRIGVKAIPGSVELIHDLRKRMPVAIASGATRRDIDLILGRLGVAGLFEPIVTADDVERSKPDPQSYALAAAGLAAKHPASRIEPGDCLAIEDTAAGVQSARSAGLLTLGVGTTGPVEVLHQAHRTVPALVGVTADTLRQWFDD